MRLAGTLAPITALLLQVGAAGCSESPPPVEGSYAVIFRYTGASADIRDVGVIAISEVSGSTIKGSLSFTPPYAQTACYLPTNFTGTISPAPSGSTDPGQVLTMDFETTYVGAIQCTYTVDRATVSDGLIAGEWDRTEGFPGSFGTIGGTFSGALQ